MFTCTGMSVGYILKVKWPGYRIYVPSVVFGIVQLFDKVIVPINTPNNKKILPSIVKLNNFGQSTWCEMENHHDFITTSLTTGKVHYLFRYS